MTTPSSHSNLKVPEIGAKSSSMALLQQRLSQMGSYAKYYKALKRNPYQVNIRCGCGRSRNMAWMFLCLHCATNNNLEAGTIIYSINSKQYATFLNVC